MLDFFRGLTRVANVSNFGEAAKGALAISPRGELITSQGLPERSELTRLGASWGAQIPTGSAFSLLAAWPTTRAELVLNNGESAGGKTYVIDRVWMLGLTTQGAAQPSTLLGQLAPASLGIAVGTDNAAVLRQQLSGKITSYAGNAKLLLANTAFALTNHWFPLGTSNISPMTTNAFVGLEAFCYGRYLVPPGAAFCMAGLAGTAAGTALLGIEWTEVQLQLT